MSFEDKIKFKYLLAAAADRHNGLNRSVLDPKNFEQKKKKGFE
jgi:hypothetical protein